MRSGIHCCTAPGMIGCMIATPAHMMIVVTTSIQ
jgi:hypothetical protein